MLLNHDMRSGGIMKADEGGVQRKRIGFLKMI